ncbi:MAG: ribosomal RNA small subunit methyltransferase A [Archaeoglobales archaeon]|nr:MAG: ribosomal RNA small subunit methyltransferase A [Archaeoglobales archaeon]
MRLHKGQHILINKAIANRMADYASISCSDTVLEVGCGTGVLTSALLRKAGKVYGIEIDGRFIEILRKKFRREIEGERFVLIHGDALKVKFPSFNKFVSNIPYSISSPLTFKLLKHDFDVAVIMYQREFAERLVARRGRKYGRLSATVRAYATPEILEFVGRRAFKPVPAVDSAIVRLIRKPEIFVDNLELFEDLVRFCFSRRRKKVGKIIEEWMKERGVRVSVPKEFVNLRPENLRPEDYAAIVKSAKF